MAREITWAVTVLVVAWVVSAYCRGEHDLVRVLSGVAGPVSAVAATITIRCYMVRLMELVRTQGRTGGGDGAEIRAIR